jgi:hypothetical protein
MVFALPGFSGRLDGAAAMVASYGEFMERATLTACEESAPAVDVWGCVQRLPIIINQTT